MEVLVVIDMQNDFINGALGTKEAEVILPKVINRVKAAAILNEFVIYTQDTHDVNYLDTQEGTFLPVKHCIRATDGWQLPEELQDAINKCANARIEKEAFGTFAIMNTLKTFEQELEYEVDSIEICGLCTDICVITNALLLKTAFPEVVIHVEANCCAGTTPEKHKAALEVMRSCQINVIRREDNED